MSGLLGVLLCPLCGSDNLHLPRQPGEPVGGPGAVLIKCRNCTLRFGVDTGSFAAATELLDARRKADWPAVT